MSDVYDFTTPSNSTPTSRARAEHLDSSGTSSERATDVIRWLRQMGTFGSTTKEYAAAHGFDSLPTWVTGIFSAMHEAGSIVRIDERRPKGRGASYVYVHNEFVGGRPIKPFKSNEGITAEMRDDMVWAIGQIEKSMDRVNGTRWIALKDTLKRLV